MTFLQPPISFRRKLSGDEPASTADSEPATPAIGVIQPRLYVFAGLSGAAAAAVVAVLLSVFPFQKHEDPRLVQAIHDTDDLHVQVQGLTDKLRALATESVATGQATDALDGRLKSSMGEVDAIKATLAALVTAQQRDKDALSAMNSPALFGVAVVQLRDRLDAGLPFDWELVNLRGIVGTDPALVAEVERLAPMATSGVVTQERLLSAMRELIARESPGAAFVRASLSAVSLALGSNLINPPTNDSQVLSRAYGRLAAGDSLNFVREMQGLSVQTIDVARPVITGAKQRMAALQAVQSLLRTARTGLQAQLRSAAVSVPPAGQ